jgi:hypothetical protein
MISKTIKSFMPPNEELQKFETLLYKRLHSIVANDNGVPTLKKRSFDMPGHRKILNDSERK